MNRKIIGVLIIVLSLIIIGGIIFVLFFSNINIFGLFRGGEPTNNILENNAPVIDTTQNKKSPLEINPVIDTNKQINISVDPSAINEKALTQMAASFVERFGSYSNQSNYNNINDLKIFMTKNMSNWADKFIKEQREKSQVNDIYYGITTKAVSEKVQEFDEDVGQAEILVSTRRREALGTTNNVSKTYNQNILVTFVKERGSWKVDSAYWQD